MIWRSVLLLGIGLVLLCAAGCQSPARHLQKANRSAAEIIAEKQLAALGHEEPFTIETAADRLRRRLLLGGQLPFTAAASLGSRHLEKIDHWPEDIDPKEITAPPWEGTTPLQLSLFEALQVAARNSRTYQSAKEEVFSTALALDLERNDFRSIFSGQLESELSTDKSSDPTISGSENSALGGAERLFKTGVALSAQIGLDLVKLLTLDRSSSLGLFADASISIPLLRASGYLGVLQQLDQVKNAEENYRRLINSSRRGRRLADAGRLPEIQLDQAIQEELRARERWVAANQAFSRRLDEFKISLGLPVDAVLSLDRGELERLTASAKEILGADKNESNGPEDIPPADAPIVLAAPGQGRPGPYEMEERSAIVLALGNRLDLRIALAEVSDAQRGVVVTADNLRAELTLLGSAAAGEVRSLASADLPDAKLRPDEGRYAALLSLDLPWERTAERIAFRQAIIDVEAAVRSLQAQEDEVKLEIRNDLRDLVEAREGIRIQAQAVTLAERRVKSTGLFLQAGRACNATWDCCRSTTGDFGPNTWALLHHRSLASRPVMPGCRNRRLQSHPPRPLKRFLRLPQKRPPRCRRDGRG